MLNFFCQTLFDLVELGINHLDFSKLIWSDFEVWPFFYFLIQVYFNIKNAKNILLIVWPPIFISFLISHCLTLTFNVIWSTHMDWYIWFHLMHFILSISFSIIHLLLLLLFFLINELKVDKLALIRET